jgi:hypothetical protein
MSLEATKMPREQNSFLDALRSEIVAGSENLTDWLRQIQDRGAIENLFALETWLKAIRSFLKLEHLPLSDAEKNEIALRPFAPEIGIIREGIRLCESHAYVLLDPGLEVKFEDFVKAQMRRDRIVDYNISRIAEQLTPADSLSQLLELLNDLRIMIDGFPPQTGRNLQLYLTLGRCFGREIKNCRYVDMLMSHRFKLQYDLVDNKPLIATLRRIPQEAVKRNVVMVFLYLFRFLKYLTLVSAYLTRDRPLKQHLMIFSLMHEEMGNLSDLLSARPLKNVRSGNALEQAAELIAYSMKTEFHRVQTQELVGVSGESDPRLVYSRLENSHGLLHNCCQICILTLVQAIDKNFDPSALFPSSSAQLVQAEKVRQDLWDLRRWLMDVLENKETMDAAKIIERVTIFKDASMHSLMYRDWGEFEAFSDTLAVSIHSGEIRTNIRRFISYLENLIQEVSKRSVFREELPYPA